MKAVKPQRKSEWEEWVPLWLHGRPESTQGTYKPVIRDFARFVKHKPISELKLKDLQDYEDSLTDKRRTVCRKITTIKSLSEFLEKTGMIPFNFFRAMRTPKIVDDLAEKILEQEDILRMIAMEKVLRDHVLLQVLYGTGIRASECSGLRWMDAVERDNDTGQITVVGKGEKTRSIRMSEELWKALLSIKPKKAKPTTPIFRNASGKAMSRTYITTVVARAAKRAGIPQHVSAHWMRHGHATHALDNGASLALISRTLGHADIAITGRYLHVRPGESSSSYIRA